MTRFKQFAILASLCLMPSLAGAAVLWEGSVGDLPVVVRLDSENSISMGSYFYRRHLLDIPLSAQPNKSGQLIEGDDGPRWRMRAAGKGAWEGVWTDKSGRELPIRLRAIPIDGAPDAISQEELIDKRYEQERRRDLKLQPGKQEARGNYQIQWWEEPRTKIRSIQIVSGYPDAVRQRMNQVLRERQWRDVSDYFQCKSSPRGGDYEETVTLHYIDADALSLSFFTSYYCGGAHPDFADSPLTLDGRSGEALKLEDVLYLSLGTPPTEDSDAWYKYRGDVFAPWVARVMARLYPKEMPTATKPDACAYDDPEVWRFVSWHLTPQGVYIGPSFARVERACEYPAWSVLPWNEVRQHPGRVKVGPASMK